MKRGHTQRGRERATRGLLDLPSARPLIEAVDHGPSVRVEAADVGATGDRWVDPFLEANTTHLTRLGVSTAVDVRRKLGVRLTPGSRTGAVPLLSPSTRRVAAGLLVAPRFRWSALGAVLSDIGFQTEASLGGTPLVPGSAREVPTWLLAAPAVRRLEALLRHHRRGFTERVEVRQSPRGRVDWPRWARTDVPSGRWTSLPCHFTELDDDPDLMAAVRWTLGRLDEDLASFHEALPARLLRERVADLQRMAGEGDARRPRGELRVTGSAWVAEAAQAMGWVADERGLGGARVLDGMSWDLRIDEVWEAWVDAFVADLAPRCGFTPLRRGRITRRLNWSTPTASMRALIPDSGMRGPGRLVWVDAKYKTHLQLIASKGWSGLTESTRDAHRADLHQALAYAALDEAEHVDSMLVYPEMNADARTQPAVATVASGKRRVRLWLMGLPFGFQTPDHRERTLNQWRERLSA
ncbi:MAG: hypothetical protein IT374_03340 [Polyangiaceae bacterium]|nr:hypothetical protein [Polyangiaceae bacterium]